jgi:carbon monoxide dehydrogenase subunit G
MAIKIKEQFAVKASIETVWAFVVEPARVVTCMPGAELVEQLNDNTYLGKVKVKLGAITTAYKGEVVFATVDADTRTIELIGEGRETGGGTAKGTVNIELETVESGTQMTVEARVDVTGKVMQMGRGMIKGVSAQLFKQFAANLQSQLEPSDASEDAAGVGTDGAPSPLPVPKEGEALAVAPLLAKTLWEAILGFFRRLLGQGKS